MAMLFLFPISSFAQDVGFTLGHHLRVIPLSGQVTVICVPHDPFPNRRTYQCRGLVLEPSAYDYFRGPKGLKAETVTLTAIREDGSTRSKSEDYDSHTSRSKKSFNLWISTLFQRPLLKEGRNKIDYTLVQSQTVVGQGQFEVLVQRDQPRQCPYSAYTSMDPNDCSSQFTVCERYFYQYDNCTLEQ